jgi:hypothetical protein
MQVPGKEFTKTCKGLVVVLLGGYALLHFVPASIDYLAIVPAKYVSLNFIVEGSLKRSARSLNFVFCILQDNSLCMDRIHSWVHRASASRGELVRSLPI